TPRGAPAAAFLAPAPPGPHDGVQCRVAPAERATDDDEPIVYQPVHEGRVLIPGILGPDLARRVPTRTVDQCHREVGHGRRVKPPTATKNPPPPPAHTLLLTPS